jgi:predicted negative regulator of RcsB-dependent stress response
MAQHLDLEEQEQLDRIKHFWNAWGTLISSVVIVVFGGMAAWNGYQYWQGRQAMQAAALNEAIEVAVLAKDNARIEQAFADLKSNYGGTTQAGLGGLQAAKALVDAGKLDAAKGILAWVAGNASDAGHKALARLRLSSVLVQEKAYDEALKELAASMPPEFDAVIADRKGDILVQQDKKAEAIAEYTKAYKRFEEGLEFRRLVEAKLNALGVDPAATTPGAQK